MRRVHALPIIKPHPPSLQNVCGRPHVIDTMTSAASPSKPSRQQQPQTNQPQPPSQAPVTPASPPARRADLKSWWKKFQVQSTKHHETRGKPASPVLLFIVLLDHITPSSASSPAFCCHRSPNTAAPFPLPPLVQTINVAASFLTRYTPLVCVIVPKRSSHLVLH